MTLEDTLQEILALNADIEAVEKRVPPSQGADFSRWLERAEGINELITIINNWQSSLELGEGIVANLPSPELVEEVTTKVKAIEDPSLDALLNEMGTDFHSLSHALEVALWQPPG